MNRDLMRFFGIIIITLCIAFFIYPTIHYYPRFYNDNTVLKINRLNGDAYLLDKELDVWRKVSK